MNEIRTVSTDHIHDESNPTNVITQVIYFIAGVLTLFLALRFLLIFIGANNTGIVNRVYQITQPFVSPFYGILGGTALYDTARIEWESILAIIAIAIITYILGGLSRIGYRSH